jgi:hypothetical protein
LMWQAVNKISFERGDASIAQGVHALEGRRIGLVAPDNRLNGGRKILNSDAGAIHALGRQSGNFGIINHRRINLDRKFKVVRWWNRGLDGSG